MALNAQSAGYLPPVLYSSLTAAEPMIPPAQSPTLRLPGREVPHRRLVGGLCGIDGEHAALALDVLLLDRDQEQPLLRGHGGAVQVRADVVVPDDGEVGAPEPVHVAGARGDVEVPADRRGRRLEREVVLVARVARVPEQQPLVYDDRLLPLRPRLRLQRVERVEPAALHADVEEPVVEEAAAVAVTAVVPRLRRRQAPQLLAAAERHGAQRRHRRVVDLERVAAPRPGDDDVLVVGARRRGVLEHRRAALDDVVELVRPDDLARWPRRCDAGCTSTNWRSRTSCRRRRRCWAGRSTRSRPTCSACRSRTCPSSSRCPGRPSRAGRGAWAAGRGRRSGGRSCRGRCRP